MVGEATPVQIAGFVVALRAKGESPDEVDRAGRGDARASRRGSTVTGPGGRHLRHRRRPGPHGQHLDDGRDRRRRHRRPGRQARQPGGVLGVRLGRPARGARASSSTSRRPAAVECVDRAGIDLLLRADVPPGAAARRGAAPRARRRRPSSTSSGRWPTRPSPSAQAVGVRRPADGRGDGRGAGRPRRVGAGVPRRRRARRAHAVPRPRRSGWCATARSATEQVAPGGRRPGPARPPDSLRGGDAGVQRRGHPAVPGRARPARCATRSCSTRRRPWWRWSPATGPLAGQLRDGLQRAAEVGRQRGGGARAGRLGRDQPGRSAARADVGRHRPGCERLVGALDAEGERRLEVVLGVGAEGDVGLGRRARRRPC